MDLKEARKHYARLHGEWAEAHLAAVEARQACTKRFVSGPVPTVEDLQKADRLEASANELRDALDEFVGSYFGD